MLSFFYSLEEFVIFSLNVWKNLLVKPYEPIVFLMVEKIWIMDSTFNRDQILFLFG